VVGDKVVNPEITSKVVYEKLGKKKSELRIQTKNLYAESFKPLTSPGISVLPFTPPNALPRHVRPVT
jgi:hypothetical protein